MSTRFSPKKIGKILDESLRFIPGMLSRRILGILASCAAIQSLADFTNTYLERFDSVVVHLVASSGFAVLGFLIFYYLQVLYIFLARNAWLEIKQSLDQTLAEIKLLLLFRILSLGLIIAFKSMALCLLLIIPGLIYGMNRILAVYELVLEKRTIQQSLGESKFLMTHHPGIPWYSFRTPIMRASGMLFITMLVSVPPGILIGGTIAFQKISTALDLVFDFASLGLLFFSHFLTFLCTLFSTIAMVGLYYDLRARAYGTDIRAALEG